MGNSFGQTFATLDGEKEFTFLKVNKLKYAVSIIDDGRIRFNMYKDKNDQWKIDSKKLPGWVLQLEIDFNDAIDETL